MKAYSSELRRDVLDMAEAGMSTRQISCELQVSESWVRRVKQQYRETGKSTPATTRNCSHDWDKHAAWLRSKVEEQSDIYLRELEEAAAEERNWNTSKTQVFRALKALGITRKKRR